jgi:hypothetical protein
VPHELRELWRVVEHYVAEADNAPGAMQLKTSELMHFS